MGQYGNLDQVNRLNFVDDDDDSNEDPDGRGSEDGDSDTIPARKRAQLAQYMKMQLREHVQTNRNFTFNKHMRLSERAQERRQDVNSHQKYCWGTSLMVDLVFQVGFLMASLPVIDEAKYGEVWGKAEDIDEDDHRKSAKLILEMNVYINISAIVLNCLAFAFSR